jgi:hypothetical protein
MWGMDKEKQSQILLVHPHLLLPWPWSSRSKLCLCKNPLFRSIMMPKMPTIIRIYCDFYSVNMLV